MIFSDAMVRYRIMCDNYCNIDYGYGNDTCQFILLSNAALCRYDTQYYHCVNVYLEFAYSIMV